MKNKKNLEACTPPCSPSQVCIGGVCGCGGQDHGCLDNKTCCPQDQKCCLTYTEGTICCPKGNECVNNACATCGGQNCTGTEVCYNGECYPEAQCFDDNTICCAADQIFCNGACCTGQCLNDNKTCCPPGTSYCQGKCNPTESCCGKNVCAPAQKGLEAQVCCDGICQTPQIVGGVKTGLCCGTSWYQNAITCCGGEQGPGCAAGESCCGSGTTFACAVPGACCSNVACSAGYTCSKPTDVCTKLCSSRDTGDICYATEDEYCFSVENKSHAISSVCCTKNSDHSGCKYSGGPCTILFAGPGVKPKEE